MSTDDILSRAQPPADARIPYGSDPNQFGELRLPKGRPSAVSQQPSAGQKQAHEQEQGNVKERQLHPVVMNIHGGFWRAKYDLLHASHLCAALTRAGAATWNLEYRRVGNAGGAWPGTFEDITNGYRFLRQIAGKYHLDLKRCVVMGHSAGGQLAIALAGHQAGHQAGRQAGNQTGDQVGHQTGAQRGAHPPMRGVVSLAGVLDLQRAWELHLSHDAVVEFLGGTPEQVPDHYREADAMQLAVKAEQHIIHGDADDIVPVEMARKYVAAKQAKGEKVRLHELPKTGHFELIDPESTAWGVVEKAVMGMLKS